MWQIKTFLKSKSLTGGTPENRSSERYRRIVLSMLAGLSMRGVSAVTMVISVPLTINYLGTERYGMWITMSAMLTILAFADLGIGNGLLNKLAYAHGRDDREGAQRYISSAFIMLSGVALLLGVVFMLIYPHVPWERFFNVTSTQAVRDAGPTVAVAIGCFLISIPLGIVQRVQQGYQEGYFDSFWQAVGKCFTLAGVLLAIYLRASLPWLIAALMLAPIAAQFLNGIILFGIRRPWLRPHWGAVRRSYGQELLEVGLFFFILQLASVIGYSSDSIVLAHIISPNAVSEYTIVKQLFSIIILFLSALLMPTWPAYGEATARGDRAWVGQTFVRSVAISLSISIPFSILLVLLGQQIVKLWVGDAVTPSPLLLVSFGIWTVISAFGGSVAMLLNGLQVIRFQAVCSLLMAASNIVISVVLTETIGISGVIWGSIVAQLVFILLPSMVYILRLLRPPELQLYTDTTRGSK
ncbi:MAG: oligosaccharide flippase family protein [Anaerolineae bacterium]|nr:oligosaccharide flippase family protein [Anaerolineae bacterium]